MPANIRDLNTVLERLHESLEDLLTRAVERAGATVRPEELRDLFAYLLRYIDRSGTEEGEP